MNKKGQQGKVGFIILMSVVAILIVLVIFVSITTKRESMKQDVTLIERLKFVNISESPNETLVNSCNDLYQTSKPQTYFLQMYDCLKNDITLEKIEVTIAYENLTRELLDEQCECLKEGRNNCKIYKCGEMNVWGN